MQRVKAHINNMPVFETKESGEHFIVARVDEETRKLWYYGSYPTEARAYEVAQEIRNGIVLNLEIIPEEIEYNGYLIEYEPESFSIYNPQRKELCYAESFETAKFVIDQEMVEREVDK